MGGLPGLARPQYNRLHTLVPCTSVCQKKSYDCSEKVLRKKEILSAGTLTLINRSKPGSGLLVGVLSHCWHCVIFLQSYSRGPKLWYCIIADPGHLKNVIANTELPDSSQFKKLQLANQVWSCLSGLHTEEVRPHLPAQIRHLGGLGNTKSGGQLVSGLNDSACRIRI